MPSPQTKCTHCGTPFSPRAEDEQFCCHGCAYAYELIRSSGLTRY
ncbi:MAG: heavy metal translocating P-type ATPase metal-binding domain-containing protein, partial [Opitutales bacterium]